MKQLHSLVQLIYQNVPSKKINSVLSSLTKDELQLFNAVHSNDFQTDIEASKVTFNIRSSNLKYKKIKNGLKDKLFDILIFLEPKIKGAGEEFKKMIEVQRASHISNIMNNLNSIQIVAPILEGKFRLSRSIYNHNASSVMANHLMPYYAFINPDKQKFFEYKEALKSALDNYYYESLSNIYYSIAQFYFSKNKSVDKSIFVPEINGYIDELKPFLNKIDSIIFYRNFYTLIMMVDHVEKNYDKVIETCDQLLTIIYNWPIKTFTLRKIVIRHKIEHLILLSKFDEAVLLLEALINEEVEGTVGWYNSYRHLILCQIYQKKLAEAYDNILFLVQSKHYKNYKSGLKYLLGFINLYLNIIGSMGFFKLKTDEPYSVKKFLKEFPNTSKDKAAMNIPIIIAQLFEAIISDNQSEVFERLEALKKYSSRYITKNNSTRSNCFINMLIEVSKQNYHPVAIQRHAQRYVNKLNSISREDSSEAAEVEFIPYDYQWELLLEYLKNRRTIRQSTYR